jgi:hypothetical protein
MGVNLLAMNESICLSEPIKLNFKTLVIIYYPLPNGTHDRQITECVFAIEVFLEKL